MNLTFRNYEENDYSYLRDMMFSLYEEDPVDVPMTEAKIKSTIHEYITHPEKIRISMICIDEIIIGYGLIVLYWSNEFGGDIINIDEIYIKEEYRNKQAASSFINYQKTAYGGAVAMQLETTPTNIAAVRLYKRLGFEPSPNCQMTLVF